MGNCLTIDDFGVSDAILLGGANSGQTSVKCRDLACDAEPLPLKNCKGLSHGVSMQKNPQTREDNLWIFKEFHGVMRVQSPTCIPAQKFRQWHR